MRAPWLHTLLATVKVEAKLFLREPMSALFGLAFPTGLLLALGAVPALQEPSADFGGERFIDQWAPTSLVFALVVIGLLHIPTVIATYREQGVLRRMATTPVHPGQLLIAQLVVALGAALLSGAAVIVVGHLVLDIPLPAYPGWLVLAFLVGFGALLSIGMLIAAVAPTARAATAMSTVAFMLGMFAGGVYVPRFLMPEALLQVGEWTPPGVQGLLDAWVGTGDAGPDLLPLVIMAAIAVVCGGAAARFFRWG